jgi:hypothetical protein
VLERAQQSVPDFVRKARHDLDFPINSPKLHIRLFTSASPISPQHHHIHHLHHCPPTTNTHLRSLSSIFINQHDWT